MLRRSFPLLTVLALLALLGLLAALMAAGPVSASSPGCLNVGHGCGANVDPATGLGWHPKGGAASPGNPVNAYPVAGGVSIPALPYEIMLNMAVGSPVSSSYHTVPGSSTPRYVMRVAEVQAWTP